MTMTATATGVDLDAQWRRCQAERRRNAGRLVLDQHSSHSLTGLSAAGERRMVLDYMRGRAFGSYDEARAHWRQQNPALAGASSPVVDRLQRQPAGRESYRDFCQRRGITDPEAGRREYAAAARSGGLKLDQHAAGLVGGHYGPPWLDRLAAASVVLPQHSVEVATTTVGADPNARMRAKREDFFRYCERHGLTNPATARERWKAETGEDFSTTATTY